MLQGVSQLVFTDCDTMKSVVDIVSYVENYDLLGANAFIEEVSNLIMEVCNNMCANSQVAEGFYRSTRNSREALKRIINTLIDLKIR